MTSVFIGGSRAVSRLNSVIREKLDDLAAQECLILVGDANGADKAVQRHFADRDYRHVVVYCMDKCRNNLGGWPTKQIRRPGAARNFAYYAAKDLAMTQEAKCGLMLWDGRSKGTLNNIQNLVRRGKPALVYFSPERVFCRLSSPEELRRFLGRCDDTAVERAQRDIERNLAPQAQLAFPSANS